ncbi:MAG: TraB/GumN family protein, partial [bacterium]|nr:TraB/GumN family protein [bacterium]
MRKASSHFTLCLALLVLGLGCATPTAPPARFVNETIGIASDFSPQWTVGTDRETAPLGLGEQFPANKGPDDALLLLAARSSADAFARVWIEPVPLGWGASDYLAFLDRTIGPQLEIFEARHSEAHDVIRWSYRAKSLDVDLTFVETIAVREGYGVRIGYWTFSTLMSTYREEFDRLADAWLFENATQERWVADWAGLSGSLSSEDLDFIKIVRRDGAAGCGPGERQLLWEVTGPKGSLFLFGSVHLGEPSNYPLPPPIESAFARSESLIVEFDITTPAAQREVSALMEQLGTLPPGEHIADHISPAAYRRLEAAFEDLGVPIRNFTGLKPWSLAMIVSMLKIQTLGYMDRYGVDRYFLQRAGAREIVSIETPDEQLRMLDSFDG